MGKFVIGRGAGIAATLLLVAFACGGCEKRNAEAQSVSPTSPPQNPSIEIQPGPAVELATVSHDASSLASFIHFPKDPALANVDSAVQFYCDVSADGAVRTTYALVGDREEFKEAVQSALDWGHFTPAKINGNAAAVYVGGTVLFIHDEGAPVIVISLATADRARVGNLANYLQPQMIGGLRARMEETARKQGVELPHLGGAEVLVNIGEHGEITSASVESENPKGIGLGEFLSGALKEAHFTPAYIDGKPGAGQINVVANFEEF